MIRKEFEELHRYIDEEKATFLESVEGKAAQLITSIESQVKQTSDTLQRLKEMQSILETLGNESQLDFIRVSVPPSDCLRKVARVSQALPRSARLSHHQPTAHSPGSFPGQREPTPNIASTPRGVRCRCLLSSMGFPRWQRAVHQNTSPRRGEPRPLWPRTWMCGAVTMQRSCCRVRLPPLTNFFSCVFQKYSSYKFR